MDFRFSEIVSGRREACDDYDYRLVRVHARILSFV